MPEGVSETWLRTAAAGPTVFPGRHLHHNEALVMDIVA